MKKWIGLACTALILIAASGCSGGGAQGGNEAGGNTGHSGNHQAAAQETTTEPTYTVDGAISEENGVYYVTVDTDWKLTEDNYGGSPVEGQGHVHFYLNGSLVGPITSLDPFEIKNPKDGANIIKLELANHDHSTFGVTKELTFEKK
ncbi:hypothetical protein [Paenibacillus soyae]|uniref:CHRD domain-containing protein n=1 Tax=Paenibacillus soyae TaxID=2969249 RepID=A0A9X2MR28_9BACL|nr:hypothetical protein [Paenibacillus soyae]MCR2806698.1 hypothetical protein [Paenibacillus soyae]